MSSPTDNEKKSTSSSTSNTVDVRDAAQMRCPPIAPTATNTGTDMKKEDRDQKKDDDDDDEKGNVKIGLATSVSTSQRLPDSDPTDQPTSTFTRAAAAAATTEAPMNDDSAPDLDYDELRDAKMAIKIVQERIRMGEDIEEAPAAAAAVAQQQQAQSEALTNDSTSHSRKRIIQESIDELENPSSLQPPPLLQQQRRQQRISQPGAVRVPGINGNSNNSNNDDFTMTENIMRNSTRSNASSQKTIPFEPDVPIEARLVESLSRSSAPLTASQRNILVQAMPMDAIDESYLSGGSNHQRQSNSSSLEMKEVVKDRTLTCKLVTIGSIFSAIALAVGLTLGFVLKGDENAVIEESNHDNVPFHNDLSDKTLAGIVKDGNSPEAKANTWLKQDPFLEDYSLERKIQRFSLATIYYATSGDKWLRNDHWLDYNVHECDWYSSHTEAVCDSKNESLLMFNLSSNNLQGEFPLELDLLTDLRIYDVSYNDLIGKPPSVSSSQVNLESIVISHNRMEGPMTADIGWINQNLHTLRIDHNFLTGTIPPAFNLIVPKLQIIDASHNNFFGPIPDIWIAGTVLFREWSYAFNDLTGTLPPSLAELTSLESYNISGNAGVTGTIPTELTTLVNLTKLDVAGTSITGQVPSAWCEIEDVEVYADCDQVQCCL